MVRKVMDIRNEQGRPGDPSAGRRDVPPGEPDDPELRRTCEAIARDLGFDARDEGFAGQFQTAVTNGKQRVAIRQTHSYRCSAGERTHAEREFLKSLARATLHEDFEAVVGEVGIDRKRAIADSVATQLRESTNPRGWYSPTSWRFSADREQPRVERDLRLGIIVSYMISQEDGLQSSGMSPVRAAELFGIRPECELEAGAE